MSTSTSLTDAILAFVNEPDWATRKKVVERHRDLLLGDEADSVLEAAVANNARRPEVQQRFNLCRTVLADCRAIGVDAAFVLAIGVTPGLKEALADLLGAESATAAHDTTVRHQALLLTDEADWVLAALAYERHEETFFVERIAHRRELLGRCRSEGIERAFADMLREDRMMEALEALIPALGSVEGAAVVLKRYEDVLLSDSAVRSLLDIARVDGVSTASRTYLLPPFEQFIARCFFVLTKDAEQDPGRQRGDLGETCRS